MTGFFQQARDRLSREFQRHRSRPFMEATMAASALVATADGEVNLTEASMIDQAIEAVSELKLFDAHEETDLYRDWVVALADDRAAAEAKILKLVSNLAGDDHAARVLLKVCVAIGKSDADFSAPEKDTIMRLAEAARIPMEEIGF